MTLILYKHYLVTSFQQKHYRCAYRDILAVSAQLGFSRIHLADQNLYAESQFGAICHLLISYGFILSHRQHLANLRHISAIDCRAGSLTLDTGLILPLARRRVSTVYAAWTDFLKNEESTIR